MFINLIYNNNNISYLLLIDVDKYVSLSTFDQFNIFVNIYLNNFIIKIIKLYDLT